MTATDCEQYGNRLPLSSDSKSNTLGRFPSHTTPACGQDHEGCRTAWPVKAQCLSITSECGNSCRALALCTVPVGVSDYGAIRTWVRAGSNEGKSCLQNWQNRFREGLWRISMNQRHHANPLKHVSAYRPTASETGYRLWCEIEMLSWSQLVTNHAQAVCLTRLTRRAPTLCCVLWYTSVQSDMWSSYAA